MLFKAEAERKAATERRAKEEAERKVKEEAERQARIAAARTLAMTVLHSSVSTDSFLKAEAERKAAAERRAKEEAERKAAEMFDCEPNLDATNTLNSDVPLTLPLCHPLTGSALVLNAVTGNAETVKLLLSRGGEEC